MTRLASESTGAYKAGVSPTPSDAEDKVLVRAAQANPQAFVALYQRYYRPIYRYCYVRLASREAAEDATSEVFLKALAHLAGYQGGSFVAWLFRMTHNLIIDQYRQRRPMLSLEMAEHEADPNPTPLEMAEDQADRESVRRALERLPEDQRTVIELTLAGWSGEQIARALDKSPAAVKMDRYRAMNQVRLWVGQPRRAGKEGYDGAA